jgi:F-type H+-transporting ATPase subunit b
MDKLGFNAFLFLSQLINFGVMIFILHKLLYSRILEMLNKRTQRIEESIKDADQVKEQLANAKRDYEAEMARARQEGQQYISQAQERAKAQEAEIIAQARQEADRIRAEARESAERERDQMMSEVKDQLAELVSMAASRVLQAEVTGKHDKLINESLSALGRQN